MRLGENGRWSPWLRVMGSMWGGLEAETAHASLSGQVQGGGARRDRGRVEEGLGSELFHGEAWLEAGPPGGRRMGCPSQRKTVTTQSKPTGRVSAPYLLLYSQLCLTQAPTLDPTKNRLRISPAVRWIGICLPLQRTCVRSLVWEDSPLPWSS